jgi:hypothetical protein
MNGVTSDRTRSGILVLIAFGLLVFGPSSLCAQETGDAVKDSAVSAVANGVSINGFVSTTYSYNFNRPATRMNGFRVFDFDDNDFKIDVAEIVLQENVEQANDAGFRMDVAVGASIPRVTASRGLFRSPDGTAQDIDVQQAYVSWIAPLGEGLRIDFGKFITPHGYEVIEGYDGYNDNATRSFLFGYAIPFTHTGLRLTYSASRQFSASVMAMNGWDVVKDNNRAKSACAQLLLAPVNDLTLSLAYIGGAERDNNDSDLRHLFDLVAIWKPSDRFSIGINGDYGVESNAVAAGQSALWQGVAAYMKLSIGEPFTLALRGEYFEDRDGARTGIAQILKELTLTPEYHPMKEIAFRMDLRIDLSTANVFDRNGTATNYQPTLLLNALYAF